MYSRIQRWFGNGWMGIVELLITALCVFFAISVQSFCRCYAAYKMGDDTAKDMGRLNLSPSSHIDPIGAICMFLFGFGWAKPLPINPRNFKEGKHKKATILVSLAGSAGNLIIVFVALLILRIMGVYTGDVSAWSEVALKTYTLVTVLLSTMISLNTGLAVFHLLPIPPLDGWTVLTMFLPAKIRLRLMPLERYGFIILIVLIYTPIFNGIFTYFANLILVGFNWIIGLIPFL